MQEGRGYRFYSFKSNFCSQKSTIHSCSVFLTGPRAEPVGQGEDARLEASVNLHELTSSWEYSDVDPEYGELWSSADKVQGSKKNDTLKCYGRWKEVETLVDVGGWQGTTMAAIVATHPHIRGINFDLPHAVTAAPIIPGEHHVAGDLLNSDIPCGDTMLLKNAVHIFFNEVAIKVLQNCKKSLPS